MMSNFYSFDDYNIPFSIKALFWGLYMVIFVYAVWKTKILTPRYRRNVEVSNLLLVYFIAYAVFYCVNPDYFAYRDWFSVENFSTWPKEEIYINLILFCRSLRFAYQYEVFRLIIWGGGLFIAYQTFRLYNRYLLPGLALLFLFILTANTFCYARASLAMAIYFFGIAFYLYHIDVGMKALGVGLALASFIFHHELIVAIAALPCLFIPLERKSISRLSFLWLSMVVLAILFVSSNAQMLDSIFESDYISSRIEGYSDKEQGIFRVSTFINYFKYYYPFYVITRCFWKQDMPRSITSIYRIWYAIILMTVAFMIIFGLRSTYTYRVLYISMIPMSLLLAYCYSKGYLRKKQILIILLFNLLSNSTRFINA